VSKEQREERRAAAREQREAAEREAHQSERRRRRLLTLGGVLAAAVVVVVVAIVVSSGGSGGTTSAPAAGGGALTDQAQIQAQLKGIPQHGITLGKPNAPITVVEYGDMQCPICANLSNTVLPGVVSKYIRTGQARLQFRNISFIGPDSSRLAQMAAAAGEQNKLFDFIGLVYANQGEENSGYATDAYLRRIGSAVPGLDVQTALRRRSTDAVAQQMAKAESLAQAAGVQGTPTVFVGRSGQTPQQIDPTTLPDALAQLTA
jgi:protein-disulfide isomerase